MQYLQNNGKLSAGTCFNLPSVQEVNFYFYTDTHVAFAAEIKYSKGDAWGKYFAALKKTWGQPSQLQTAFVGNQYASWRKDGVFVELDEPHMSFEGTLTYMSTEYKDRIDREAQEKKKKNQGDLDSMI